VIVDNGAVGSSGHRRRTANLGCLPLTPLAAAELVLVEVVLVAQIRVGVEVACVAAKDEHAVLVDACGVVVAGRGRRAVEGAAPGVVRAVVGDQVVEHLFAVVAAEYVEGIPVGAHGVLGASEI